MVDVSGTRVTQVEFGCLQIRGDDLGERLRQIHDGVRDIVERFKPVEIAAEKVFVHRNPASAIKLGQARGAALVAGVGAGLTLYEYSPNEIKLAVTGDGAADKAQMEAMVQLLLGIDQPLRPVDAADAVAVALCHLAVSPQLVGRHR